MATICHSRNNNIALLLSANRFGFSLISCRFISVKDEVYMCPSTVVELFSFLFQYAHDYSTVLQPIPSLRERNPAMSAPYVQVSPSNLEVLFAPFIIALFASV